MALPGIPAGTAPGIEFQLPEGTELQVPSATVAVDPVADVINTLLLWGAVAAGIVIVGVIVVEGGSFLAEQFQEFRRQTRGF